MYYSEINKNNAEVPIITRILHRHAEETISDEQVQRVLSKVFEKIDAGEFDRSKSENDKSHGKKHFKLHLAQINTSDMTVVMIVKLERF